ncbi:MAG: hypothetical protein L0Y55_06480, partial [Anaerolineales bacterium]|nr:hypothetical protein [Anaerolineales bacterium]
MTRRALVFLLALLPAIIFLLQGGYFASSDGMIHLYRLFELDRGLREGILFPRWFPLSGYGYGLPVLNYYPPLMYYLAELFHLLGAGYIVAIKLTIATGFAFAAIGMFLFARDWLNDSAAFIAAIAYAYSPYLLSDAYVRGNFPEMLAMSLLPFALWAVAKNQRSEIRDQKTNSPVSNFFSFILHPLSFILSFAAIILAHHLTAMQFAALLLAYVGFLFLLDIRDQRSAVSNLVARGIAVFVALALSAFYWVPALAELNLVYVESGSLARFLVSRLIDPADFFAPALAYTYLPQSDALKHAFGFPQTMLVLLAGVIVSLRIVSSKFRVQGSKFQFSGFTLRAPRITPHAPRLTPHIFFFFLLVAFSIFMTLTLSAPLWYAIPTLRFMQFPWRFQILATIGIAFLMGVWAKWIEDAMTRWRIQWIVSPVCALALIALGIANLPVRAFPLDDAQVDLTRADDNAYVVAQMGWGWTREFVPATVQEFENIYVPLVKPSAPPPDPARPIPSVQILNDGLYTRALRVSTAQPFELSLKTFFFPGWQAYIDGALARTYPRGALGLVSVAIPSGDHAVVFRFEDTPLRVAMNVVSLVALVGGLAGLFIVRRRAFVVVLGVIILITALFAWHTRDGRARTPIAVSATLDSRVQLIGHTIERADKSLSVTIHWLALNEMDRDYHSYIHLIDAAGNVVAQHDGLTDQGL